MDVFRQNLPEDARGRSLDPRLQPTPDYGTLGPGSDVAKFPLVPGPAAPCRSWPRKLRLLQFVAMMGGIVSALLVSSGGGPVAAWGRISSAFSLQRKGELSASRFSDRDLDRQKPQKQAEILLTRAVRNDGASTETEAEIESRVQVWRGKLKWDPQLGELTTAALNSNDHNVRTSAIEVQLAAYGLAKSEASVDSLVRQAGSSEHSQKIWALWALGLLGNRGVEAGRVVEVLTAHLKGSSGNSRDDEDARRWAVEGLALVGTTSSIVPLLDAMHDDPSALVRERAACSLAESGMLSHEQRLAAVPQLIKYSDDPALDAQTRGWAFQALGDITAQRLPNDAAAWRSWYQTAVVSGQ